MGLDQCTPGFQHWFPLRHKWGLQSVLFFFLLLFSCSFGIPGSEPMVMSDDRREVYKALRHWKCCFNFTVLLVLLIICLLFLDNQDAWNLIEFECLLALELPRKDWYCTGLEFLMDDAHLVLKLWCVSIGWLPTYSFGFLPWTARTWGQWAGTSCSC